MQAAKKNKKSPYRVEEIDLNLIDYDEQQIRAEQVDDDIHELASSIEAVDLLQVPGVIELNGRYALAWGRRRLEALRLLGYKTIPCRIYEGRIEEIKALALVENLQRRQMSIVEEVEAVRYLAEAKNMSIDQIVQSLGRSRSYVLMRLAIPNLVEDVRTALINGEIGLGAAEALAICQDDSNRRYLLSQVTHKQLNLSELKALVAQSNTTPAQEEAVEAGLEAARSSVAVSVLMFECAACQRAKPADQLTFVRVCLNGCEAKTTKMEA